MGTDSTGIEEELGIDVDCNRTGVPRFVRGLVRFRRDCSGGVGFIPNLGFHSGGDGLWFA